MATATKRATKRPRYCKRHRSLPLVADHDAEGIPQLSDPVSALITRYRFGAKRKKPHYVYWYSGKFYRALNAVLERDQDGAPCKWEWCLVPIDHARAWDAFERQTIEDGKAAPVSLVITYGRAKATGLKGTSYEGLELLSGDESEDYVADLLDLDRPRPAGRHFK